MRRFTHPALLIAMLLVAASTACAQGEYTWRVHTALNATRGVAVDNDGLIWSGTSGGIYSYDPVADTFAIYRTTEGLLSLSVTAIAIDPGSGDVWVGGEDGSISIYNRSSGRWRYAAEIAGATERPERSITAFSFASDLVYIGTSFGMAVYDPRDSVIIESAVRFGTYPAAIAVNDLVVHDGRIWVATPSGLASAPLDAPNLGAPTSWSPHPTLTDAPVRSLALRGGELLAGSEQGVFSVAPSQATLLPASAGMTLIESIGEELHALQGGTLYRLGSGGSEQIATLPEPGAALAVGSSRVVVALPTRGIALVEGGSVRVVRPDAPGSNRFTDLALTSDGAIWTAHADRISAGAGVSRLLDGAWRVFDPGNTPALATSKVWNVGVGGDGALWAGTYGGGAVEFRKEGEEVVATRYTNTNSPLQGIPDDRNFVLAGKVIGDREGRSWITNWDGSGSGPIVVAKFAGGDGGFEPFTSPTLPVRPYRWIVLDDYGTKWIGADATNGIYPGLVYINDGGSVTEHGDDRTGVLTPSNTGGDLLSLQQTALAVDRDGELWIGTPRGVSVLVNPYGVTNGDRGIFRRIRGLADVYVYAIAVDALNRKWIGTDRGVYLMSFDGEEVLARYTTSNSPLASDEVRSILAVEATGDVYIGTLGGLNQVATDAVLVEQTGAALTIAPQPFVQGTDESVRISGLPAGAIVKILTASGRLVREFASPGGAVALWDGLDANGDPVPSGIYIVAGASPGGEGSALGKVAVIRP